MLQGRRLDARSAVASALAARYCCCWLNGLVPLTMQWATRKLGGNTVSLFFGMRLIGSVVASKIILGATVVRTGLQVRMRATKAQQVDGDMCAMGDRARKSRAPLVEAGISNCSPAADMPSLTLLLRCPQVQVAGVVLVAGSITSYMALQWWTARARQLQPAKA